MKHISEQQNRFVIALHNVWSRIVCAKRIGLGFALKHRCRFQRWCCSRNLLCWCGGVKIANVP